MAKTKQELDEIKIELKELNDKLKDLSEDELQEVCGGVHIWDVAPKKKDEFNRHDQDVLNKEEK